MSSKPNIFIEPIIMKKKRHDFKAWRMKRAIVKKCKHSSPSFDDMCCIAEFLALLRSVYMYGNDDRFHLFLSTYPKGYTRNNCYSMVYREPTFSIAFVMLTETREIQIEITRTGQNIKSDKEVLPPFKDGEYKFKDSYDEERMLFIISSLMHGVIELIEWYYKNKKF